MEHCHGEGNEIYEQYCFHMREEVPAESGDSFNCCELRNLAKTCHSVCCCLRDLIRDRIVLGINSEHTTKKLLRRRLPLT